MINPSRLSLSLVLGLANLIPTALTDSSVWVTPHDSYSSSVGVLGCKINTNRVAYWPWAVDCDEICVKVSYAERTVHLLRIDHSGGAYDISYDAWNYLQTGKSATKDPISGGAVAMTYENASAADCKGLIDADGLPLSAPNSMDYLTSCLEDSGSWVGQNYVLYNIDDSICSVGYDEKCTLNWAAGQNQATCHHTLGLQAKLTTDPVYNIRYPTGVKVLASTGAVDNSGAGGLGHDVTGIKGTWLWIFMGFLGSISIDSWV